VRVIVDCLVRFDALLVVAEDIFEDWDYLSNSTKATAFTASFKTLCSSFQRLQPVAAALLITLAFTITTYIIFVASSSVHATLLVSPIDFIFDLVLAGTVIAVTVAGLMAWRTRRRWQARRLARQLYWLARPHVGEVVVWGEVVFEVDVEMEEMA
jgi:hypothetical protein